jgi:hypothetical protein
MVKTASVLLAVVLGGLGHPSELPSSDVQTLVRAVYRLEGGGAARVPYGILSVKVSGPDEARAVCTRTIVNTHARWIRAGRPGNFLDFLADRYCPPSVDPVGNRNWKHNIKAILNEHRTSPRH